MYYHKSTVAITWSLQKQNIITIHQNPVEVYQQLKKFLNNVTIVISSLTTYKQTYICYISMFFFLLCELSGVSIIQRNIFSNQPR